MSIDTKITVSGWVGTQPRHVVSQNGTSFTVFRMGSTKRYYDRAQESWVDGATTWYTVKTWRGAAVNVAESLRRSDPVLVHGSLATETWESPEGPRTSLVVEADALGPDLTRGQATFRHTVHVPAPTTSGGEGGGTPAADTSVAPGLQAAPSAAAVSAVGSGDAGRPLRVLADPAADDPWGLDPGPSGAAGVGVGRDGDRDSEGVRDRASDSDSDRGGGGASVGASASVGTGESAGGSERDSVSRESVETDVPMSA